MLLRALAPKASVSTVPPPQLLAAIQLSNPGERTEMSFQSLDFFSEGALVLVFAMMPGHFPIRLPFLVEMDTALETIRVCLHIRMEAGVIAPRESPDKAHLASVLMLK